MRTSPTTGKSACFWLKISQLYAMRKLIDDGDVTACALLMEHRLLNEDFRLEAASHDSFKDYEKEVLSKPIVARIVFTADGRSITVESVTPKQQMDWQDTHDNLRKWSARK